MFSTAFDWTSESDCFYINLNVFFLFDLLAYFSILFAVFLLSCLLYIKCSTWTSSPNLSYSHDNIHNLLILPPLLTALHEGKQQLKSNLVSNSCFFRKITHYDGLSAQQMTALDKTISSWLCLRRALLWKDCHYWLAENQLCSKSW